VEPTATSAVYPWSEDYTWDAGALPELCEKEAVQGFARTYQPAVYLLLSLLGAAGNGLVLLTHTRYRRAQSVSDVCLLHLALSDLLLLLTLPFAVTVTLQGWAPGTAACRVLQGLYALNFYSGFLFLTCISVDRYVAIVRLPHSLAVLLDTAELLAAWEASCEQSRRKDLALLVTGGLACLRCCLNPLLYAFLGQRFRRELWMLAADAGCVRPLEPRCAACSSPRRRSSLSTCQ
ncbi:CCR10 protein, partial [Eudromia elegans]|nr:CCR10 protein [Eudromia elegans]